MTSIAKTARAGTRAATGLLLILLSGCGAPGAPERPEGAPDEPPRTGVRIEGTAEIGVAGRL